MVGLTFLHSFHRLRGICLFIVFKFIEIILIIIIITNLINSFISSFFSFKYANLSEIKYLFYEFIVPIIFLTFTPLVVCLLF